MNYISLLLSIILLPLVCRAGSFEHVLLNNLRTYAKPPAELVDELEALIVAAPSITSTCTQYDTNIPLFSAYPGLQETIAYKALAQLPTPIQERPSLATLLGVRCFFEKQDGATGTDGRFGGNKVRKLSFLLAQALQHRDEISSIITYGCAGSNHALATAAYAQLLGLPCTLFLKPQHPSHVLQRNLLMDLHYGAQIIPVENNRHRAITTVLEFRGHKEQHGKFPYLIPTGGSCPLGILGFVNAIYELKDQISEGLMPEPDRIYAPLGSAGTVTGLLVGLKAVGLKSRLYAITVEPEESPREFVTNIETLFNETVALLCKADPTFPHVVFNESDVEIVYEHCGQDYALFTPEGITAMRLAHEHDMQLDGVYTGKAFAGLIASLTRDAQQARNETILFWNTFDSTPFTQATADVDYHRLPENFHSYFENPVQPLDRDILDSKLYLTSGNDSSARYLNPFDR